MKLEYQPTTPFPDLRSDQFAAAGFEQRPSSDNLGSSRQTSDNKSSLEYDDDDDDDDEDDDVDNNDPQRADMDLNKTDFVEGLIARGSVSEDVEPEIVDLKDDTAVEYPMDCEKVVKGLLL